MLEEKIVKLTEAVERLSDIMRSIQNNYGTRSTNETSQKEEIKGETKNVVDIETKRTAPTISTEDLQELCAALVRKDRALKAKIKETIKTHGGNVIKDVPADNLPALKAALEVLG